MLTEILYHPILISLFLSLSLFIYLKFTEFGKDKNYENLNLLYVKYSAILGILTFILLSIFINKNELFNIKPTNKKPVLNLFSSNIDIPTFLPELPRVMIETN